MAQLNLKSWDSLTRFGVPRLIVVGRPLLYRGEILPIGAEFNDPQLPQRSRQFYEQRRIRPVPPEPTIRSQSKSRQPVSHPAETVTQPSVSAKKEARPKAAQPPLMDEKPARKWGRFKR